jgi:hypothetical protein
MECIKELYLVDGLFEKLTLDPDEINKKNGITHP